MGPGCPLALSPGPRKGRGRRLLRLKKRAVSSGPPGRPSPGGSCGPQRPPDSRNSADDHLPEAWEPEAAQGRPRECGGAQAAAFPPEGRLGAGRTAGKLGSFKDPKPQVSWRSGPATPAASGGPPGRSPCGPTFGLTPYPHSGSFPFSPPSTSAVVSTQSYGLLNPERTAKRKTKTPDAEEATLTEPNPDVKTAETNFGFKVQHPKWRLPRPQHSKRGRRNPRVELATPSFAGIGCALAAPETRALSAWGRPSERARRGLLPAAEVRWVTFTRLPA